MNVALNEGVARRGLSGTAVGMACLNEALQMLPGVTVQRLQRSVQPGRGKVLNAVGDWMWDMYRAPRKAHDGVIIHPANIGLGRRGLRSCVVMNDTMVLDHPEWFDGAYAAYARLLFGVSVRHADLVLTPSHVSCENILRRWRHAAVRVLPWPLRVDRVCRPRTAAPSRQILVVAATETHKRHDLAIETARLVRLVVGADVTLKIVGSPGRSENEVAARIRLVDPGGEWITRLPRISDDALVTELDRSWVLLATSRDEGFCLPLVEAAGRSLPVVHTGAGAMREVMPIGVTSATAFDLADAIIALDYSEDYRVAAQKVWERAGSFDFAVFRNDLASLLSELS